jgi:serine protease Do
MKRILLVFLLFVMPSAVLAAPLLPDFADLSQQLQPAVVNISTAKTVQSRSLPFRPGDPRNEFFDDFFRRYFGDQMPKSHKEQSLGTGFLISADGFILTNNHVVNGADQIKIRLSDDRTFDATVRGTDEKLDLALLKIDASTELPFVPLGNSDDIRVGEWVLAIGNPFGLGHTVTAGIVSAKGRVIGAGPYDDFIQTDASINPGNSGGPLFNIKGEVIGINTAIVARGQGIGFAIPINMAQDVLPQLKSDGKVTRGWLGVQIQPLTEELAKSFGIKESKGALVTSVVADSPADRGKGRSESYAHAVPQRQNAYPSHHYRSDEGDVINIRACFRRR